MDRVSATLHFAASKLLSKEKNPSRKIGGEEHGVFVLKMNSRIFWCIQSALARNHIICFRFWSYFWTGNSFVCIRLSGNLYPSLSESCHYWKQYRFAPQIRRMAKLFYLRSVVLMSLHQSSLRVNRLPFSHSNWFWVETRARELANFTHEWIRWVGIIIKGIF